MRKFYLPFYSGTNAVNKNLFRSAFGWMALAALFFVSTTSKATHLAGGELTYRWISGTTYEFTATFYRDCAGINAPNTLVLEYGASCPGTNKKQATMTLVPGTGQEISFSCGAGSTTCNGGTSPGFQEWKYTATVDLKKNCSDWVFSWSTGKRNNAITTLVNPGGADMYIEATLDNLNAPTASSPTFTNVPVAQVCAGQPFTYNQGAIDPNGDSLAYSFLCPRIDATTCVTYNAPYSATNPIAPVGGTTIDATTGNIIMNPSTVQVGVATVLVKKYRNGVLIGSVLRDMEILVVNCTNNLPTATGINGTNVFGDTVCAGSNVCFNILSNDIDAGQVVTMTWNNTIDSATFITTGTPHPTGTFCWTPSPADARVAPYTFTVTVRDNNCPTNGVQAYAYSIWVPPIEVNVSSTPIDCNGSTGTATATGAGGVEPYSYLWSPGGQTTSTATGLTAGTYTVVATDFNGCSASNTVTLANPDAIIASILDSTNVSCNGGNDGSAEVTASGGSGSYTHHWSDGQTTNPATGLAAGTYTDTVTDASGCTALVTVVISEPDALTATITTTQNASCKDQTNGVLVVTPGGGTGPYTYEWFPVGGTDSTVTGLGAGTYTVVVTDANNCTATQTGTITEPSSTVPLITAFTVTGGNNISCFGETNGSVSVTVTGGTAPYTYEWSPGGATDSTLTGLGAGQICVHVTDDNGCTADTCITLTQPDTLIIDFPDFSSFFGGVNVSCNGATDGYISASVTGGTPGYTYSWEPNTTDNTADVSGLGAGTYTVTVTDTNGCSASRTITLIEPDPLVVAVSSHTDAGCKGDSTGSITVTPSGGTAPYSYAWSTDPNDTTATVTGLPAGIYTVQVTDMNGCIEFLVDTITEPSTPVPNISAVTVIGGANIACSGDTTGTAWVEVTGGTPPYTFEWSVGGATTDTLFNLGAGPIEVIVTDSNGCRKIARDTISQPEPVSAQYEVSTKLGGANVSCSGSSDGSITQLAIGGGTPGYTYQWTTGGSVIATTADLLNVGAGDYKVLITDTNGCSDSLFFTLIAPDTLDVELLSTTTNGGYNISCNGAEDGDITVEVSGGTGPFSYTWDPPVSNASTASGLAAGTYIITVCDTNGCCMTDSITLTEPPPLVDTLIAQIYTGGTNVSCYGYADGCLTDSVSGGTAPYTYQWSTGDPEDTSATLCLVPAGTYTVFVTDANGCTAEHSATLTEPDSISGNPVIDVIGDYNIGCAGGTACIQLNPSGGTAGYTYYWTPGENPTSLFCDTAGTYHVLITDTNGCVANLDFTLTQPELLTGSAVLSNYGGSGVSCNATCDGSITAVVSGGVRPYQYTWDPPVSTDSVATGLCEGSYTITVTDSNGCSITLIDSLSAPLPLVDSLTLSDYAGFPVSCAGNDGSITVTASGGTAPYTYNWSTGHTTSSATGLIAGTYTVTVTDSNGCSVTDTVTLTAPQVFDITDSVSLYNGQNISCNGAADAFICVNVSGGVAPYSHQWNTGDTTSCLNNLGAGTYTDTITDQQGCKATITRTITEPEPLSVVADTSDYGGFGVRCNNDASGWIHLNPSGGTIPYTYQWSPGPATTQNLDSIAAGTYTYTVTDANGCTATGSVTLTNKPDISANAGQNLDLCGDVTALSGNTPGNGTIGTWTVASGNGVFDDANDPNTTVSELSTGTNVLVWTVTDGFCPASDSITINAFDPTEADGGEGFSMCPDSVNEFAVLNATPATQPAIGFWHSKGPGSVIDSLNPNTHVKDLAPGVNTFIWFVTNGPCVAIDTVDVTVRDEQDCFTTLEMPTGFTPNGDGHNDYFEIHGIQLYPSNNFKVFNRWGNKVFEVNDYDNASRRWAGENESGEILPDGTYFAILVVKDGSKEIVLHGYVDVRR